MLFSRFFYCALTEQLGWNQWSGEWRSTPSKNILGTSCDNMQQTIQLMNPSNSLTPPPPHVVVFLSNQLFAYF